MESRWECRRCGACCRWPGEVRLVGGEAARLAAHLGITERGFADRYTRLAADRKALSLVEREDGTCVFLDGEPARCRVHEVKPQQCRTFPNGWSFPGFERVCAAALVPVAGACREAPRLLNEGEDAPGG